MSPDTSAMASDLAMNDFVGGALVAALVAFAVITVVRVAGHIRKHARLHCRKANKRFMAGYRAGFRATRSPVRRTTATALMRLGPPMVRPRAPTDAGKPRRPASAGSKHGGRSL